MNVASEILEQLDQCARDFTFPMLDNGYVALADTRMHIYRGIEGDWLMIIEVLGTNVRGGEFEMFQNCLHTFGSAVVEPGTRNGDFLGPIDGSPDEEFYIGETGWISDSARTVVIRGTRVQLDLSPENLEKKGIMLLDPLKFYPDEILRTLVPEHRDLLLASDEELWERNPSDLPLWMRLDEWNHPDVAMGELPSQSETFRMLADAIATGDKTKYHPTLPANTHWQNWPTGGTC